jgi:RNA polymerase sigma-70 factor (ECF subfamily)
MSLRETRTTKYLKRWHEGDDRALDDLLAYHLPWLRGYICKRMGGVLKGKGDTDDYLQDALVQFLRYSPKIQVSSEEHFRALLARIAENSLRNNYDHFSALRRKAARERPLPDDTVLHLDPPKEAVRTPSQSANRLEREAWVRFAMELLAPDDREVLVLRQWERLSFSSIARRLEITDEAAWMRHKRALNRLAEKVWALRRGRIEEALDD